MSERRSERPLVAATTASSLAVAIDGLAVASVHALACVLVRRAGFDHVSDDDFARVTIAQAFAHAPKLDPTGTSWLPFPFWILGGGLAIVGRSLDSARALSVLTSSLAILVPFFALRTVTSSPDSRSSRLRTIATTLFAYSTPWALWLGASTVPESVTASLAAGGAIGVLGAPATRRTFAFAFALFAACLSRYEPWPIAAVVAITLGVRAARASSTSPGRGAERELALVAAIVAAAPLLWMAWNAHAHDGPLHFFRRVSSYKRAIGDGSDDALAALALYPKLILSVRPEVILGGSVLGVLAARQKLLARSWLLILACALAQIVFLSYGNVRDGAPAHHPERALVGTLVLLAMFTADAAFRLAQTSRLGERAPGVLTAGASALFVIAVVDAMNPRAMPAKSESEDRTTQIARGLELRGRHFGKGARVVVTPCAYEHFALIAAFGRPEDVEIKPSAHAPVTSECPDLSEGSVPP